MPSKDVCALLIGLLSSHIMKISRKQIDGWMICRYYVVLHCLLNRKYYYMLVQRSTTIDNAKQKHYGPILLVFIHDFIIVFLSSRQYIPVYASFRLLATQLTRIRSDGLASPR